MKLAIALLMFTISIFADPLLGSVYAQDDVASKKSNKIAAELNAAVDDYSAKVDAAGEKFLESFDKLIKRTEKNKRLDVADRIATLEQLKLAREEFNEREALPEIRALRGAIRNYQRTKSVAAKTCVSAYKKTIDAYGKLGDLASAKIVLKELEDFRTNELKTTDPFPTESKWKGEFTRITSTGKKDKGSFQIDVLTRDNNQFTARVNLSDTVIFIATGQIQDGEIMWNGNNITHEKGVARHNYRGKIASDSLKLEYGGAVARNQKAAVIGTVVAKRVNNDK